MPAPHSSARPTGRADRGGRHRARGQVPGAGAQDDGTDDEWGDEPDDGWGDEPDGGWGDEPDAGWDDDLFGPAEEDAQERVPLLTVPESLRSLDVQVGVRAVRGLLLLALVVVLVLGGRWWWVQQGAGAVPVGEPAPLSGEEVGVDPEAASGPVAAQGVSGGEGAEGEGAEGEAAAGGPEGEQAGSGPDASARVTAEISVVVHVVGEVRSPGIVELPAGARVADAVAAAGGLTDAADQTSLNLARALVDGEQVWVGAPGEEPPAGLVREGEPRGTGSGPGGPPGDAGPGAPPVPLDLNRATQAELEELPGIGPVTAGRVLAWREEHGRFSTVEELMEVSGIGERTFAQLEPLVTTGG